MSTGRAPAERILEGIDLKRWLPDPEAVRLLPRAIAARYYLAPLTVEGETLRVAMRDPNDLEALDYLEMISRRKVVALPATEEQVRELIQRCYGGGGASGAGELEATVAEAIRLSQEKIDGTELPIVRLVDQILGEAVRSRATDIHLQPEEDGLIVRFRVDGVLRVNSRLPREVQSPIVTRTKILANLDISERRVPQDGKIELEVGAKKVDLRVSTLPTVYGENVVIRVLDHGRIGLGFEDLGFAPEDIERITRLTQRPNGILLVTGPTGSGKTTTLYSAIRMLDRERLNIMTLEDPVEYRLPGIRQSQIAEKAGYTFAGGLRSLLRQDPDVILLGEMRDSETAEIAVRAALTGHLVLSTLHTNGAIGSLARLRDLGIEDFLMATTLAGILAQRLVRKLCPECSRVRPANDAERHFLGVLTKTPLELREAVGCAACQGAGFKNRFAVYELLEISTALARIVGRGGSEAEVEDQSAKEGFVPLRRQAVDRIIAGWSTVEELARVVA